jgi:hypothetical protein
LRVLGTAKMEESEFLLLLADTVRSLLALYPTALLSKAGDCEVRVPETLDEECGLDPLYDGALILGVMARRTGGAAENAAFLSEADHAYRKLWRAAAARRRAKMRGESV